MYEHTPREWSDYAVSRDIESRDRRRRRWRPDPVIDCVIIIILLAMLVIAVIFITTWEPSLPVAG